MGAWCGSVVQAEEGSWDPVYNVPPQPFVAATDRLIQALEFVGRPLSAEDIKAIEAAKNNPNARDGMVAIQKVLDPHCLALVHINAESRVSAKEGPVEKSLMEQGWRSFLIKVHNEAGITPRLVVESSQALPVYQKGKGARQKPQQEQELVSEAEARQRFLDISDFDSQPLKPQLSGLLVEYRVVHLFSRDTGKREATFAFHVGQGTQDLGFRGEVPILFDCEPAVQVLLGIHDDDGTPTTAALTIRDTRGRVVPNPARRLAPDFFFHSQIYRADGEYVSLPPGKYTAQVGRGPEYLVQTHEFTVPAGVKEHRQTFELTRWIHPKERRWYSGDHHVHAAGCAHYDSPTEGVGPEDMMRHILGEDLNVGCVLSWGPCWYTQKQFFEGRTNALSRDNYLMRYDVEVSGFPSSHAGHLCLLRLSEDDYPGTTQIEEWPSWTLPVLQWGQEQGGVVGYSHSGWGLALPDIMPNGSRQFHGRPWGGAPEGWQGRPADKLPDYAMPRFDGIGANEFIVTGPLGKCDFISAVDTPAIWELNIWYHLLNCDVRTRISGETDFPCIYGDKVGLGRIYVELDENEELDYDRWVKGLKDGRSYCGDGLSHVFDFRLENKNGTATKLGTRNDAGDVSQVNLASGEEMRVKFSAAALLEETPTDETRRIRGLRLDDKPFWHIERCRIGDSRDVPVEVIVNGEVAHRLPMAADGSLMEFDVPIKIEKSSWVAVRILPSVHTNPIWVNVDNQPVYASDKSAEWCRKAVDVCWNAKQGNFRQPERASAKAAYDAAAEYYDAILESLRK
ncbi:MAG: CehA/McbA family metallohydrolase [Planctomycetaceae bacterium]|nr:CehA/McbA family metallohydrolase [Planctomycetaceae bacterium]MCB9949712.1 CehA/McbA family metallohydrolase [Planctomycetaceae bacterium]